MKRQHNTSIDVNINTAPAIDPNPLPPQPKRAKRNGITINNNDTIIIQRNSLNDQLLTNDLLLVVCDLLPLRSVLAVLRTQYQWFHALNGNAGHYCTGRGSLRPGGHWQLSDKMKRVMLSLQDRTVLHTGVRHYGTEPWFQYLPFLERASNEQPEDMETEGLVYMWSRLPFMPPLVAAVVTEVFDTDDAIPDSQRSALYCSMFFPDAFLNDFLLPLPRDFRRYLIKTCGQEPLLSKSRKEIIELFPLYLATRIQERLLIATTQHTTAEFWCYDFHYWSDVWSRLLSFTLAKNRAFLHPFWYIIRQHVYPNPAHWPVLVNLFKNAELWMFISNLTGADFFEYLHDREDPDVLPLMQENLPMLLRLARLAHGAAAFSRDKQQDHFAVGGLKFERCMLNYASDMWLEGQREEGPTKKSNAYFAIWGAIIRHALVGNGRRYNDERDYEPSFAALPEHPFD